MNTEIIITFLIISLIGMFAFWLMYRKANNTSSQAQAYLLSKLQDSNLGTDDRQKIESQLSELLQNNKTSGAFKTSALLTVIIIIASFVLYNKLGTPDAKQLITKVNQNQSNNQSQSQAPQMSMQEAIAQLEQRLAEDPEDVDGQMLYARSQISLKNYDKAVIAYRKSNQLAPNEAVILTELAEAIALANNNRSFLGEPEELLAQAIEIEPTNQKALWLLGMTFYERKDFEKTNQLWTKLYDLMGNESAKNQLAEQLADVRNKLGIGNNPENKQVKAGKESKQPEGNDNALVTIQVNLDELLIDNLKGKRALLYVYTKAATGMPMPIAVIRKPLEQISKSFPITVSINDENNLQPTRKLSTFDSIIVGARISFTGNAMPQAGDLQSTEIKIDLVDKKQVELVIDKVR